MTSLKYFKDEKEEYDPYTKEETNVSEVVDCSDYQVERNLEGSPENRNEALSNDGDPQADNSSKFTSLFSDLDDDLLDSIDKYLYKAGIKRESDVLLDDLEEPLKESQPLASGKRAKRKSKKEEDGTNGTGSGGDSDVAKGGGSDSGSGGGSGTGNSTNANDAIKEGNDATGRTWSEKLSRIGSRRNSFEEDEVISITDTTPPKLYTITTNIDTAPTDEAAIPASLNYEEDLPIKKSRLKIIPDSQRYTSSDSGTVKEEFALTSMEICASTGKCSCSSACDHTACNCSHHHACHMGCGVCGFDLLGHRLASSANGSNGAQGSHGMTSTLFPRSKDGITKSVASEDDHSNVATPKNKYADSNDGKRANVTSPSGVRTNVSGSYDSDSSEEEEDVDECIICSESMKSELKNEIGVLDVCSHIFCFKCIKMWSDRANSCPLCKREFAHIRKVNLYNIQDLIEKYYLLTSATANAGTSASAGIGGSGIFGVEVTGSVGPTSSAERRENKYWRERRLRCIRKNKISKLKKIIREMINWYDLIPSLKVKVDRKKLQGEEEDEGCAICGNDDNWPQLLLCDNCDKGYHMYCLDPPLTEVPPNNWYCAQCNMEAGVTIAGETYGLRRGSTGTSGRSESTRGRRSRRHNSTTTESTRATRRSRSTRASSRSLLDTLLQEQAEELDMMSLEGRSGSGIVSRDSLENIIRDSIISISSTATNPRTSSLNTVATSGRRPRRRGAEAEALEEEVRTNLLSQVYMGLNRSINIERGSNRVSETMGTTGGSFGERSTSITNSILTRDFNPDIVKSNAARDWRTNRTMTPPSTSIAFEDANTENIKETVKGRLRRFNFKTKNVDQLIKESLESIDNYLAFNTVPAADIDLISQTTSTSTSALNRARLSAPTGNTESAPTGSSTANSIPSVTEDARNAATGREKKYTSFIYRYKTITSDYRERPRSQSRRQEPYINGKTVKYLF
ncbi:Requim, req/dpf2 [Theileria orientalis strain Shintoku]|uniref:Requim, req/dpf2 n=1 Tax=Theileria orientalis strain Shintoku TaxID=869250 RepID=J7MF59_THEOR|nr:Requim, req/dpf2 [Theileria orientalis strain Shintoku]BAM42454.1 Requim, req/dpf2 [Theileria orientalis strain Shintoku]|eukprot:XP_009692755.1 Requim, req/dpf2 [Theileria orientalis strain Shintoku]